jgi:hypothetical protein
LCTIAGLPAYRDEVTVLLVSGPEGMGKRALLKRLIKDDELERWVPVFVCGVCGCMCVLMNVLEELGVSGRPVA